MSLFGNITNILSLGSGDGGLGGTLGGLGGLLGGHGDTIVDTGAILGEPDAAPQDAAIDLDLDAAPRAEYAPPAINVGLLPAGDSNPLLDTDLLSGSTGAGGFLAAADIGPDGVGPILNAYVLGDSGNPLDVQLLGTSITDVLGGNLLGGDLLGGLQL